MSVQDSDTKPKRHPEYYLEDGNITFLVENDLFRVHRYFFIRESVVFRDILSIPVTSDKREGDSDDNPIILEGIRSNDFKSLLWMWYDPQYKHTNASADTWCSIMALAHRWQFETIGQIAFEAYATLPGVEPMEKVVVCEKYGFKRSIISKDYWAICTRNSPLTYKEGERLGWVACVLIASIRDRHTSGFSEQQLNIKIEEFDSYR